MKSELGDCVVSLLLFAHVIFAALPLLLFQFYRPQRRAVQLRRHGLVLRKFAPRKNREEPEATAVPQPTSELPGSTEKIEVLRQRLSRGEELWCSDDVVEEQCRYGFVKITTSRGSPYLIDGQEVCAWLKLANE